MLSGFKGKGAEKDSASGNGMPAGLANIIAAGTPPQRLPVDAPMPTPPRPPVRQAAEPAPKPETVSSIGTGMSIVGQVVCSGQARVFGRVEGELRVSDLLLGAGSQVEGQVIAQEVTVRGHVKGTIRALRVRLEDGATVEGDIFHRSLAIEEGAVFEGTSRRVDNPTEAPVSIPEAIPSPAQAAAAEPPHDLAQALAQAMAPAGQVDPPAAGQLHS
jgi:cytoskeletal protein CcmA (bactofilin family)